MKSEKHKFFNTVETFVSWYSTLESAEQKTFRMQVLQAVWPEKNRQKFYSVIYGKAEISALEAKEIANVAKQYDESINFPEQLFPTIKFNTMKSNVYKFLQKRNMTQAELAQKTGISKQSINLIVAGKQEPGIRLAQIIASALYCSVYDLFELETSDLKS